MILGLDGLRAIAILVVIGFHVNINHMAFGWMGVQFFFVLSGFLITGILIKMKENLPAREYFYKFYGRRLLRIFPLYYLYLLILFIVIQGFDLETQKTVSAQLPYAFFYIYDFFHASAAFEHTQFLSHLWSLSVEEQFYLIWPLVIFLTPKEKLKALFLSVIAAGPFLRFVIYIIYNGSLFPFLLDDPYVAIYILPFSHIDAFAIGAYISQFSVPKPRLQLAVLSITLPALGYYLQYRSYGQIDISSLGYMDDGLSTSYKFIWAFSALNYLFALIIFNVSQNGLLVRFLESPVMRYLGKISYGMYIYHFATVWIVLTLRDNYELTTIYPLLDFVITFSVSLALTAIVASLSFHAFEKPISDLKDKYFPTR